MFHRKFPDRRIALHVMAHVMKQAGMKKKVIVIGKIPARRTLRISEFEEKVVNLSNQIKSIQEKGSHLVFVDEAIFTARGYQQSAWALPK